MRDLKALGPKPGYRNVAAFLRSLEHQSTIFLRRFYVAHMNLYRWRLAPEMGTVDMLLHSARVNPVWRLRRLEYSNFGGAPVARRQG
jgi:hypothetical protein